MIPFFTFPYEDEILYSVMARYHYYTGNKNFKDTLWELFGSRTIIPSLLFPSRLGNLASKVSWSNYGWEHYLENNTMLPFYAPFMPNDRLKEVKLLMKDGDGKGIYAKVGFIAGGLCKTRGLMYCPVCVSEDIGKYGEPYFHRTHQFQGIFLCPKHSCLLKEYPTLLNDFSRVGFIRLMADNLDLNVKYETTKELKLLISIAQAGDELANIPLLFDIEMIQRRYLALLSHKGFVTPGGSIKQRLLNDEFREYYGGELLKRLESTIDGNTSWLQTITRKPRRTIHPIRHLLLILFLCKSVNEFFQKEPKIHSPFGDEPWLCLNQVANHYKKPVITHCTVTSDSKTRVPVGTFSCSCGFVYSRRGPDLTEEDKFKVGRVKRYGEVWEGKLRVLIESGTSGLRQLARIMECDPKTIIKYSRKFNLITFLNTTERYRNSDSKKEQTAIVKNPLQSRGVKEKSGIFQQPKRKRQVNWSERDAQIVKELSKAKERLLIGEKRVRITRSNLGRSIGRLPLLEHYLDRLPKTKDYLDCETESVEEFQFRRLKTIYQENLVEGVQLKKWELIRIAGIKSGYSQQVKELLDKLCT